MNPGSALRAKLRSTSFKLLAFFVVSCLAIIFLVQSTSKMIADYSQKKIAFRNQIRARYSQLLARELEGSSDRQAEAFRLEKDLDIGVRIEGDGKVFTTSDLIPTFAEFESGATRKVWTPELKTGELHRVAVAAITLENRRYLFLLRSAPFQELQLQWLSPLTVLIVLILFANYVMIRWLFRPVAWLSDGIRRLGEGDFNVQVPCRSYDELGDLANSFNETVRRVGEIVESKKQLLLDVSHELRSPLTRIKVALELDRGGARPHSPPLKDQIRRNVLVLESMIHDLLESARLGSARGALQLERVDLKDILADASSDAREEPGIVFKNLGEPLPVWVDRKRIEICVKNIFDNALKYSKSQPEPVEVSVERREGEPLRIHVRDFGVGVPASEMEMIFEPFYRIDKSRLHETGGYGLGLGLCRNIMVAHGGQVLVSAPESGSGSVFTLEFPAKR